MVICKPLFLFSNHPNVTASSVMEIVHSSYCRNSKSGNGGPFAWKDLPPDERLLLLVEQHLCVPHHLDLLCEKPGSYWAALIEQYFLNNPSVEVLMTPNAGLALELLKQEEEELQQRKLVTLALSLAPADALH